MPSNEDLSNRAKELVADVQSLTHSAKQHCDDYRALANEAYANLQAFLKAKGVANVDDWVKECEKNLSPEEVTIVQKSLADLEPAKGLDALVQPTEIAKFIASWYMVKGAMPLFQAAALSAKSFYYNYVVINRLPVAQIGEIAGEIEVSTVAESSAELTEAAEAMEGDEVAGMLVAADAEVGELVAAGAAEAAEVAAIGAAEAASAWNFVLLGVGALVLAGTIAYQKVKQSQEADKLRDIIAQVATARLYASVGEKSLLAQTDQDSLLKLLNSALKQGNEAAENFFKNQALNTIQKGTAAIDVDACYAQLAKEDSNNHAMTEADPSLQDMKNRHANEIQKAKNK